MRTTTKTRNFKIQSSVRAWTNVISARKRDSLRHSAMGLTFSENVVVKETSFKMLEVSSSDWERLSPPSIKNNRANFCGKKVQWSFSGCRYFENTRQIFTSNLIPESKGLCSLYSPTFSVLIFMSELSFVGLCFSRSSASSMANLSSKAMTSVTPFVS